MPNRLEAAMKPNLAKRLEAIETSLRTRRRERSGPRSLEEMYEQRRKDCRVLQVPYEDRTIEVLRIKLEIGDEIDVDQTP